MSPWKSELNINTAQDFCTVPIMASLMRCDSDGDCQAGYLCVPANGGPTQCLPQCGDDQCGEGFECRLYARLPDFDIVRACSPVALATSTSTAKDKASSKEANIREEAASAEMTDALFGFSMDDLLAVLFGALFCLLCIFLLRKLFRCGHGNDNKKRHTHSRCHACGQTICHSFLPTYTNDSNVPSTPSIPSTVPPRYSAFGQV